MPMPGRPLRKNRKIVRTDSDSTDAASPPPAVRSSADVGPGYFNHTADCLSGSNSFSFNAS